MKIKCWGSRGSIPVSGKEYNKYGGDTTCLEIRSKNDEIIIVDAGSGIRRLGIKLLEEERKNFNIIFTHAHWDHLLGFPFFKPIYFKGTKIDLYGCPFAQESVDYFISESMHPPYFPVDFSMLNADINSHGKCSEYFTIDSITINPILLSHPNEGIGYKFEEDGKSFVFLTDNELTYRHEGGLEYDDYCKFSKNANLLIHDAEFTTEEYKRTKTWGHTIYTDALKLALEAGVEKFGLFHHNQERADNEVDEMVENCKEIISSNYSSLECFAVASGWEIEL